MGNIALIITDLIALADTQAANTAADTFKKINLAAAANKDCVLHLEDEDETPEISGPDLGTLFISFSIWNNAAACENFCAEHDAGKYVMTSWELAGDQLPSLNEAFGRLWARNNLHPQTQAAAPVVLLEAAGRRWLQDNLGNIPDPFAYDHWVKAEDRPNTAVAESGPTFLIGGKRVSLFKHKFGVKPASTTPAAAAATAAHVENVTAPETVNDISIEAGNRVREFEERLSPYNFHLDRQLAGYGLKDYAGMTTLVNWAQERINWLKKYLDYARPFAEKGCPQLSEKVSENLKRWNDAIARFTTYQTTQYNAEFQRAYDRTGIHEFMRRQDEKDRDFQRKTNEEINDIYKQVADNTSRTFQESNERWLDAFLDRDRYVVLKKVY